MSDDLPTPVAIAEITSRLLPRGTIRCRQCGCDFEGILAAMPRCRECADRDALTLDERAAYLFGGWSAVLAHRNRPRSYPVGNRLMIPSAYLAAEANDAVAQWCENPGKPLVLTGQVGRGKTWQACGALRALTQRHPSGYSQLTSCAALARFDGSSMARAQGCIALALDDLGARITPAAVATAYELIDHRIGHGQPLIVTTNLSRRDLTALDERIESRLSSGTWLVVEGPDRRVA